MPQTLTTEQIKSRIEQVEPAEARDELERGNGVLIDTREPNEWDEYHIEGATLIPPAEVEARIEDVVPDRSQRVILYCASGNRSARAAHMLKTELGYENVANVAGGIKLWEQQGLPVVQAEGLTPEQRMRYARHTQLP